MRGALALDTPALQSALQRVTLKRPARSCAACWLVYNGRITHILINISLAPSSSAPFPKQTSVNSACCLACSGPEGSIPWTWVGALLGKPGRALGHVAAHPGHAAPYPPTPAQPLGALPCAACGAALAAVPSAERAPAWFPISRAPSTLPASSCIPMRRSPSPGHGRAACTRGLLLQPCTRGHLLQPCTRGSARHRRPLVPVTGTTSQHPVGEEFW